MARGDISITLTVNSADGAFVSRQPASGVEELCPEGISTYGYVTSAPNVVPEITLKRIDGTNNQSELEDVNAPQVWFRSKHLFDNTNYLSMAQISGVTKDMSFTTVVVG